MTGIIDTDKPEQNSQNGTSLAATIPCMAPNTPHNALSTPKAQAILPMLVTQAGAFQAAKHIVINRTVRIPIPMGPPCKK